MSGARQERMADLSLWLVLQWVSYLLMIIGVLGAILPLLPGPIVIWLGALLWAWADRFQHVRWPTLAVLGLLAILAGGSELWMSALGARKGGASWQALAAGIGAGVLGFALFSIPGGVVGVVIGITGVESWRSGGIGPALKSSGGFLLGYILSAAVQVSLSLIMVAIFAWRVLAGR
jgi:uncharacterized protein YqgC (DUF456 family)